MVLVQRWMQPPLWDVPLMAPIHSGGTLQSTIRSMKGRRNSKSQAEFMSVPKQIFGLDQLQVLEMSLERESCLTYQTDLLPHDISCLQPLTCPHLDSNHMKTIPAEIGTLSRLERLTLGNNNLSSLSPEMGALRRLCSLHLANNSLTQLPASLSQFRSLTIPDVNDNRIGTVSSSILHLEDLETLLLLFNSPESLPEGVYLLRNLFKLWVRNNHVRSLPASFGELLNLDWGCNYCSCNFDRNPLECPLPEVCSRSPERIRGHFLSFHRAS